MLPARLHPIRDDLQGSLELAYLRLTEANPDIDQRNAKMLNIASTVLGSILWLAKHSGESSIIEWVTEIPNQRDINDFCARDFESRNYEQMQLSIRSAESYLQSHFGTSPEDTITKVRNVIQRCLDLEMNNGTPKHLTLAGDDGEVMVLS